MKTYRVWAKMTTWAYLDVEAENEREAWNIANETDGGEFICNESKGDWEIDPECEIKEVDE